MKQKPNHKISAKYAHSSHQVRTHLLVGIRNNVSKYVTGDIAMQRLHEPIMEYSLSKDQEQQIRDALDSAGIHENRLQIEERLTTALSNTIDYTKNPYKPYPYKKLTKITFGVSRARGAHQKELIRMYLIHTLFLVWRNAFATEPRISRKITSGDLQTIRSPFVIFAGEILAIGGIGKPEDHLTLYRSYEATIKQGLSYEDWVKGRAAKQAKRKKLQGGRING